jgi:plastocyanin
VSGPSLSLTFPTAGAVRFFTFTDVGSWDYHCIPHQSFGMVGTVVVDSNSVVDTATVDVGGAVAFRFTPGTVTVKRGGVVRWVNSSSLTTHTVTRP